MKKSIVAIILALPVITFLFLKIFGSNEYVVPIFFENGIRSETCSLSVVQEYAISPSLALENLGVIFDRTATLFVIGSAQPSDLTEIERVLTQTELDGRPTQVIWLVNDDLSNQGYIKPESGYSFKAIEMTDQKLAQFTTCVLLIVEGFEAQGLQFQNEKDVMKAVLVDQLGRIRGYYAFDELEEYDRLGAEMDLLLGQIE